MNAQQDSTSRLRLESPCGLVVNAYVLVRGQTVALIDTGFPHTVDQLEHALKQVGLTLEEITDVFFTHTHIDHMGGAAALDGRWNPRFWASEETVQTVQNFFDFEEARLDPPWPYNILPPERASHPIVAEIRSKPIFTLRQRGSGNLQMEGVAIGEYIQTGSLHVQCLDGSGHDPLHVAWYEPTTGFLFSGDVVLSVPTPFVHTAGDDPLRWLRTLDRWDLELTATRLFPGHGMPTGLVQESITRSRGFLEQQYEAITQALRLGRPVDALHIAEWVLPRDASRFAARTNILMANIRSILHSLEALDCVTHLENHTWEVSGDLPTFEEWGHSPR